MMNLDKSVFSLRNTEIDVYNGKDIYRFSNKYDRVPEDFYNSLNQYEVEVVTEKEDAYNHICINFKLWQFKLSKLKLHITHISNF